MQFTVIDFYLFAISLLTAAISAATGLGGGIVFLIGLNQFIPFNVVVPIHGLIQLFNNLMRVFALRKHLIKSISIYFSLGALIGFGFCYFVFSKLDLGNAPYIVILILVLYSLFKPKKMPQLKIKDRSFALLGIVTGALGPIIGAVDPLLSPFFLRDDFTKENLVANKSFFQSLIHLSKIPYFLALGFSYYQHFPLIILLFLGGFLGTFIGMRILNIINRKLFIIIFKSILFLVVIRLTFKILQG